MVGDQEFDGYCAVAAGAYFFLVGEQIVGQKESGFEQEATNDDQHGSGLELPHEMLDTGRCS